MNCRIISLCLVLKDKQNLDHYCYGLGLSISISASIFTLIPEHRKSRSATFLPKPVGLLLVWELLGLPKNLLAQTYLWGLVHLIR